jgi:hypothetical protein
MKILLSFIFSLLITFSVIAQNKFTVSGYVKDAKSGESLIGANVYIKELLKGTSSNQYGFFSITLPQGQYTLVVSYIGFEDFSQSIDLSKDIRLNISLQAKAIISKEVVVTGERSDKNTQSADMGRMELEMEKVKTLPAFMGEVDVLKTIQLLPGVQSSGEGNSGFYVRGGGPDQNLILLDEAIVYNAAHLFGFFSVFNADAIKNVELIKGGMPANYGGRLASVLDISMKEGNNQHFQVDGGIGIISSRLTLQGPIKKDKASFIISGRRTYADVLAEPFISKDSQFKGSGYYFYDLNTKLNYILSDKDRLFVSAYFGRDVFSYNNKKAGFKVSIPWGNATTSLRWNHLFTDKLFMNTTLVFSDYKFSFAAAQSDFEFKLYSGIQDWNAKIDFTYFPNIRHNIKYGINYTFHSFVPSNASAKQGDVVFDAGKIKKYYANEAAIYITDDFDLTDRIRLNAGLRYSYFQHIGPFDRYVKNEIGQTIDTVFYKTAEHIKDYSGFEPRASMRFKINSNNSVKASYTRNYQYVHLASLSSISLPTDTWLPSTSIVEPQLSTQYAIGYFKNFKENMYESSVELYYKDMRNLVEYKEGALPEDNLKENLDHMLTFGSGESYGAEFFLKKAQGKFNGWIGYTLSWTNRTFKDINNGETFPAKYDRRHDLSIVASYNLNEKLTLSAVFIYGTGNAITLPVERYFFEGRIVNIYSKRNEYRMPAYHRADISVTWILKKTERRESNLNFSVYNVYNRYNPYFIYFANEGDVANGTLKVTAKQVSLFPILPSISWNFKF